MCLGGHYGYICQGEVSGDYNRAILICGQLGYDPAGEESIDTCITYSQTLALPCASLFKVPDCLQEKLKH